MKKDVAPLTDCFQPGSDFGAGCIVHCDDPCDFRPALDVLQTKIERLAQVGRPLVVLMGETHSSSADKLLRQGLMSRLLNMASGKHMYRIAYGIEREHTLLETLIVGGFGIKIPLSLRGKISRSDQDGLHLTQVYRAAYEPHNAPVSIRNLIAFCQKRNVSIRPNDALRIECANMPFGAYLDNSDPAMSSLISRYMPELRGQKISTVSAEGVRLRNHTIVERAMAHMQETDVAIYIQDCGKAHLFGDRNKGCLYEHSLSALFTDCGVDVLPVFMSSYGGYPNNFPEDTGNSLSKAVVVKGLHNPLFHKRFDDYSMQGETSFLGCVSKNSGGEIRVFADGGVKQEGALWNRVKAEALSWIDRERIAATATASRTLKRSLDYIP